MATLPSLNRRHKAGLLLVLAATGASLLLDASAKQTAGIVLLGLAVAWFIGSVAVRTLGIILSVMAFCLGLYVAVLPIWNERESVLAAAQEYDAALTEIGKSLSREDEWAKYKVKPTQPKSEALQVPPGAVLAETPAADARAVKAGTATPEQLERYNARLALKAGEAPVQKWCTVRIPEIAQKWLSRTSEVAIAAKYGGAVSFPDEMSDQDIMHEFQTKILLPRPTFSLKDSIASHRVACIGGSSLLLLGLSGFVFLVWQARKARIGNSDALAEPNKP